MKMNMFMKNSVVIALFMLSLFLNPVIGKEITTISVDAEDQKELLLSEIAKEIKVVNVGIDNINELGINRVYAWNDDLLVIEERQNKGLFLYDTKTLKTQSIGEDIINRDEYLRKRGRFLSKCYLSFDKKELCVNVLNGNDYIYNRKGEYVEDITGKVYNKEALMFIPYYPMGSKGLVALELIKSGITRQREGVNAPYFDLFNQSLVTVNKKGTLSRYTLPASYYYDHEFSFQDISSVGNKVFMHFSSIDTIYSINKNSGKVTASYTFDFGANAMPSLGGKLYSETMDYIREHSEYAGYPTKVMVGKQYIYFEYYNGNSTETGYYNKKTGIVKNGVLTNDLFEGRDIKLVGSDDHHFIFACVVPPKKEYSNSLLNALREQGLNVMVEGKQKDDRQEFTVSDKAAGYLSESDLATLSNAQEKDVILLFVKVK